MQDHTWIQYTEMQDHMMKSVWLNIDDHVREFQYNEQSSHDSLGKMWAR